MPDLDDVRRRPLLGLLTAQFFGAFNDNAFKLLVTLLGIRALAAQGFAPGTFAHEQAAQSRTTLAFVVLTLPLALFSLPAGAFVDRFSKRAVIVAMKALELLLMLAAVAALAWLPPAHWALLVLLGLMGVQSALFSPAKYGILPELVPHQRLSASNGLLEMWSFIGIVLGTSLAGVLLGVADAAAGVWLVGALLAALSAVGLVAALFVPRVAAAAPSASGFTSGLRAAYRSIRRDRPLRLAIVGIAFYWAAASLLGQDMLIYGKVVLGLPDEAAALPLGVFAVGVAAGSLLAGRLSAGKVEYGLIPLGALGVAVLTLALGALAPGAALTIVVMALLGVASGFVLVPLNALLQWRAPKDRRGAVIAVANVLSFTGILAGSLSVEAASRLGLDSRGILLAAGGITALGTIWALWLLPAAFLRVVGFLLTHSFYRLDVVDRGNVPERGGALLAPNHVSFMDGLFVMASLDRPVRFLVDRVYFDHWLLRPFMKALGFIPVEAGSGPASIHRSLAAAGDYLDRGELVCIFPEGEISRTGGMLPFRRGIQRIAEGRRAPIVPVHLDRVWGSVFSFSGGRFLLKWPKRAPYPINVSFGAPLPSDAPLHAIRAAVQDLGSAAWIGRRSKGRPLPWACLGRLRRHGFDELALGRDRRRLGRAAALRDALALVPWLRGLPVGDAVAAVLPHGYAAIIVALTAGWCGRPLVWLDPGEAVAARRQRLRAAQVKHVVVSRGREPPEIDGDGCVVHRLQDVRRAGPAARLLRRLLVWLAPASVWRRVCRTPADLGPDAAAAVVEGTVLEWGGLRSQVAGLLQALPLQDGDRLLTLAPPWSALGQVTTWLALSRGIALVLADGPSGTAVGRAAERYAADVLLLAPGDLTRLVEQCRPGRLGSVRMVICLGGPVAAAAVERFEAHFGVRPLPGLAVPACGPVIAVSSPGYRAAGFYQCGWRRGAAGHPLPGVRVRAVAADGATELPPGETGSLWVRGPALAAGWRDTGLRGSLDGDGFVVPADG